MTSSHRCLSIALVLATITIAYATTPPPKNGGAPRAPMTGAGFQNIQNSIKAAGWEPRPVVVAFRWVPPWRHAYARRR